MPATPTSRGRVSKQGTGENSNTWGSVLNGQVIDLLDEQIDGVETIALTGNLTLSTVNYASDQQRNKAWNFTGAGAFTITIPSTEQVKLVRNGTSGTLTISNGTNNLTVASGAVNWVLSDGTNVWKETASDAAAASAAAAAASASSAVTQAANAATSASLASDWAVKTGGAVSGGEYSAKYHAQASATSAATAAGSASAAGAQATNAATSANLASDWAIKTSATVDGTNYSAKFWAQQAAASSGLPAQNGNANRYLTTNGTAPSWSALGTIATRDKAATADLFAWTADKALTADLIGAAFVPVALAYTATLAWDWREGYYRGPVLCTGNVQIGYPTNIRACECRMMDIEGNDATARIVTFSANFKGTIPSITNLSSTVKYRLVFTADTAGNVTVGSELRS